MGRLATARAAAFDAAYCRLDSAGDDDLRRKAATRIVDGVLAARRAKGLAYLRALDATHRQQEMCQAINSDGPDLTLFIRRYHLYRAIEAAAAELVAAFGRH